MYKQRKKKELKCKYLLITKIFMTSFNDLVQEKLVLKQSLIKGSSEMPWWTTFLLYLWQALTNCVCIRDVLGIINFTNCHAWLFFNKYAHEHTFSVSWVTLRIHWRLCVLIMSLMRFRVNPHSIVVAWMSRNSLLETGVISEV